MTIATDSVLPNHFDFAQIWNGYADRMLRLQAVRINATRRFAEVRIEAVAESYIETFGQMIAIMATPSPGSTLVGWTALMQSAHARIRRTQQARLDIWAHAMKATADVFTEEAVDQAQSGVSVPGSMSTGHLNERRVSAEVINFADRRALQADESRGNESTGVRARRQAGAQRL